MAIVCEDTTFILRFHRNEYVQLIESGAEVEEDGVEEAFELLVELSERQYLCLTLVVSRAVAGSETALYIQTL